MRPALQHSKTPPPHAQDTLDHLVAEQTPGGLNEQVPSLDSRRPRTHRVGDARSCVSAMSAMSAMSAVLHCLPQVLRELTEAGAYKALSDSLDGALARIQQREAPKLKKTPYSSTADGGSD